jgi:hypothetical protein
MRAHSPHSVERVNMGKESVPNEKEMQGLLRILDEGLAALKPEDVRPASPCPDSETFALFIEGEVDEKTRKKINAHIAACDSCYEEYVALVGPKKILQRINEELARTAISEERVSQPIAISDAKQKWSQLVARAKEFAIDLRRTYGPGALIGSVKILSQGPAFAVRGAEAPPPASTLIEVPVADNVYGIQILEQDSNFVLDIAGYKMTRPVPMRLTVQLDSGDELAEAETDNHGYASLILQKDKLPEREFTLTFALEDELWEMLFLKLPNKPSA